MKKLFPTLLTFVLLLTMAVPVGAWETPSPNYAARYPAEYAAFDADAWFAGYYGGVLNQSKEAFMTAEGLKDEEAFRNAMFLEWASGSHNRFGGYVILVDGIPVQFQQAPDLKGQASVPEAKNGRILAPIRAIAEAMDFTVSWNPAIPTLILCEKNGTTVRFTLEDTTCHIVNHLGTTSSQTLDVAPFAREGRTYLPIRAIGEALGYTVTWNQALATAAFTSH